MNSTISCSNNDGTSWTGLGKTIFSIEGKSVCYGNEIWVAVGSGTNNVAYSSDGINWTGNGYTMFSQNEIMKSVSYGGGGIFLFGTNKGNNCFGITYNKGKTWILYGSVSPSTNKIVSSMYLPKCNLISDDQENCEQVKCSYDDEWKNIGECSKPCEGGKQTLIKYVKTTPLYGQDECTYSIRDQIDCNLQPCPINCEVSEWKNDDTCDNPCDGRPQKQKRVILKEAQYGGFCPELTREIKCQCSVKQLKGGDSYKNTLWNTLDEINWTGLGTTIFSNYCEKILYGNNIWFLLGMHNDKSKTTYSSDGLTFNYSNIDSIHSRIYNINFINDYFITIGEPNKDFIDDRKLGGIIDKDGNFVNTYRSYYSNKRILSIISFSKDCIVWEYISTVNYIFSISYGNNIWIVCGNVDNSLLYSTNKTQWVQCLNSDNNTPIVNSINFIKNVIYGNCVFVAIGDSNILYSSTGRTWKILNTDIHPENITFGNNVFVIVGNNNSIATSSDGKLWSPIILNNLSRNLFFDKDKFYIIRDGIIQSSNDAKIWTTYYDYEKMLCISSIVKNIVNICPEPIKIDCKMSEWIDNSECSNPCDGGIKTQMRKILTYQENDGEICPTNLSRTIDCNTEKCKLTCEKDGYVLDSNGNCVCTSGWVGNVTYNTEPSLNKQPNGCAKCEMGKYNPSINQSTCIDCLRGTYNDVVGSTTSCKPCPNGTYNLSTGSKSIDSCITSDAGTYVYSSDYSPLNCSINTYSGSGATTCTPCPDGYITLGTKSTECIKKITELKLTGNINITPISNFVIRAIPTSSMVFNSIKIKFSNIFGTTDSRFFSIYRTPVIQQISIYNSISQNSNSQNSNSQNSIRGIDIISPPVIENNKIVYTLVPYINPPATIDTNQYLELIFYFDMQGFIFDNKIYYEITLNNCNNLPCPVIPVNCEVSDWSDWSTCSVPCGNGTQTRTRNILTPAYNGGNCDTTLSESQSCIIKNCPIDCKYTLSDWGNCSVPCGGGTMSRSMTIDQQPLYGGKECPNELLNTSCNSGICVNYDYTSIYESSYSKDVSSLNYGNISQNIQISSALPSKIYLKKINIEFSNTQSMNLIKSYSIYSSGLQLKTDENTIWVESTKELLPSNKTYILYRNNTFIQINSGSQLYLTLSFNVNDNKYPKLFFNYKVTLFYDKDTDCVLSPITWTDCSTTCGGGIRTGTRSIITQQKYNGLACPTNLLLTEQCNLNMCPINTNKPIPDIMFGVVSSPYYLSNIFSGNPQNLYSSYTLTGFKNIVSTKFYTKQDNRININSMSFFTYCENIDYPKQFNKDIYCYLIGIKFTEYSSNIVSTLVYDSTINKFVFAQNDNILNSTDSSYFNKNNNILIPSNQYESYGTTLNSKLIQISNLNVNYISSIEFIYNVYSENTVTTTLSFKTYITEIIASPTDCLLSDWGNWGDCSVPCGDGIKTRTKSILQNSVFGGQPYTNFITSENQNCNNGVCVPVNCTLSSWSNWSDCTQTCGGGTQSRTRTILSDSKYGGTCDSLSETKSCNTNVCLVSWIIGGNFYSINKISYSFNGTEWTGLGSTYFSSCSCIKYITYNNKWYVGGQKNTNSENVMYNSIDGINWNQCIVPENINNITTICNSSTTILAVGVYSDSIYGGYISKCYILNSIDGKTFTNINQSVTGLISKLSQYGSIINSIEYYNNLFVMVGGNYNSGYRGCIYSSKDDGQNWTLLSSPNFTLNKVKYIIENNIWITIGGYTTTENPILSSSDGTIWTQINTQNLFSNAFSIEYLKYSGDIVVDQYFIGVFARDKDIEPSNLINNKKWGMYFMRNYYNFISINKKQKLFIGTIPNKTGIYVFDYGGNIKTYNINFENISCIENNNL